MRLHRAPTADGMVEIAYGVNPEKQGKGYATEAAEALVAFALSSGRVRVVRAHTLPEPNASTRVLAKCGFRHIGEVVDPEDGLVWRWEKLNEAQGSNHCRVDGFAGRGIELEPGLQRSRIPRKTNKI